MKQYLCLLLAIVYCLLILSGCSFNTPDENQVFRFNIVSQWHSSNFDTYIFEDSETGVKYLFVRRGYGAGLTPLLD